MARIRFLRGGTTGTQPAAGTFPSGEPWTNFPDRQFGVVDGAQAPLPLLAVRYFSALAGYAAGDHVVQAGVLYYALVAVTPGPFNPVQWGLVGGGGVIIADTAPATPPPNALWWDSDEGGLYLYYLDPGGAPAQWVQVNGGGAVSEAPRDNRVYARRNATWVVNPIVGFTKGVNTTAGNNVPGGVTVSVVGPLNYTIKVAGSRLALRGRLQVQATGTGPTVASAQLWNNSGAPVQIAQSWVSIAASEHNTVLVEHDFAHGLAVGAIINLALNAQAGGGMYWNVIAGSSCSLQVTEYMP